MAYGGTVRVPVQLEFPPASERRKITLELALLAGGKEISRTRDIIEVIPPVTQFRGTIFLQTDKLGPDLKRFLETNVHTPVPTANVPGMWTHVLGSQSDLSGLKPGGDLRKAIEEGATAIVLSPGAQLNSLFPNDIEDVKNVPGEFADFAPCAGTLLAENLQPMDLKWWGRKDDWRVFVANASHRLKPGGTARELIRYIPPHGYIPAEKVKEQYRTVLFEIPLGKGRLWVCDLDLEASVTVDPLAQQFAMNLLRAAADPHSTDKLPHLLSHEEMSKVK